MKSDDPEKDHAQDELPDIFGLEENKHPSRQKQLIRTKALVSFFAGFILGAAIWWASPHLTGKTEAWDAEFPFYPVSLFLTGIIASLVYPRQFWVSALGIYVGQFFYALIFLPGGPLWIFGMIFGGVYLLCALLGGLIVHVSWRIMRKHKMKASNQSSESTRITPADEDND